MSSLRSYEVLGIGAPILDHTILVTEEFLDNLPGEKEGMELVDYATLQAIISNSRSIPKLTTGGSCCNTIKGISQLGKTCAIIGKMGGDSFGKVIWQTLEEYHVIPLLLSSSSPTSQVGCLVTPDGKRTCRSYLGASQEMRGSDLTADIFTGVQLVHIEGYSLLNHSLTETAMQLAKNAGALISCDLGSFEVVRHHKERIKNLLRDYVDIVFANELEVLELTDNGPEKALDIMKKWTPWVVIFLGAQGGLAGNIDQRHQFRAVSVKHVVDTTGAGDLFASGFLYSFLEGKSIENCLYNGSLIAATVVQFLGGEIPLSFWNQVHDQIKKKFR